MRLVITERNDRTSAPSRTGCCCPCGSCSPIAGASSAGSRIAGPASARCACPRSSPNNTRPGPGSCTRAICHTTASRCSSKRIHDIRSGRHSNGVRCPCAHCCTRGTGIPSPLRGCCRTCRCSSIRWRATYASRSTASGPAMGPSVQAADAQRDNLRGLPAFEVRLDRGRRSIHVQPRHRPHLVSSRAELGTFRLRGRPRLRQGRGVGQLLRLRLRHAIQP